MGLKGIIKGAIGGGNDPKTDTLWTTPWAWRDDDGCYVGWNGQVWLYRSYPLSPIAAQWEDAETRIRLGSGLDQLLCELGETSREGLPGLGASTSDYRSIHIVSITWEAEARAPEGTPERLAQYMEDSFGFPVPHKTLLIGVQLRGSGDVGAGLFKGLKDTVTAALGESLPDLNRYTQDRDLVDALMMRSGCKRPGAAELRQLESWYNLGRGPDAFIVERPDRLEIDGYDTIELAAAIGFNSTVRYAPHYQWAQEAEAHPDGVRLVSIRAELEPASAARRRLRQSQRKIRSQMAEEAATGDIERAEYSETYQLASVAEDHFMSSQEPLLTRCSVVMARRVRDTHETYADFLRSYFDIDVRPLDRRQLPALDETLPCSSKRVNPFVHELSVGMIAYAGLHGFSRLGDKKGVYLGLTHPNYTTALLDPLGAPAANQPPSMGIFGDPGSGKTFVAQSIAYQSTLMGIPVIFINPKGHDTLAPLAKLAGGRLVSMSRLESEGGAFDPFRFCPTPEMAAEMLASHILSVLTGFTEQQELALQSGLRRGALSGARCAADALRHVTDPDIVQLVVQQVQTSPTFAVGFGLTPQPRFDVDRRLTLIEFDRKLDLPDSTTPVASHTRQQRIALAAIRLVTRASMEILGSMHGGVLILDEAWTFLAHQTGREALQQLGREGRSLNILPIFCTQRVADLLQYDMEGYLSRVLVMKLQEEREANAALELCGIEPTAARRQMLGKAAPQQGEDGKTQWAMAVHRDLQGRHASVLIGPFPDYVYDAFTTNPVERRLIQEQLAARAVSPPPDNAATP